MDEYDEVDGFDVVGDEYDSEVEGDDVLGDVLGDDDEEEVGRRFGRRRRMRRRARRARRRSLLLPPKAGWREGQVAPGVIGPRRGLEPLPLEPNVADGIFSFGGPTVITFTARPQRPFRSERLLAQIARSTGVTNLVLAQAIFVGTSLQQVDFGNLSLDNFRADAFGVRLALRPAEPGILIRIPVFVSPALAAGETIAVNLTFLGQTLD